MASLAVVAALAGACASAEAETAASDAPDTPTTTAAVSRGDLRTERQFRATVSYGDEWDVDTPATGTVTRQPAVGTIVGFGEVLVRTDDRPRFLAEGEIPMYRNLSKVDTSGRDDNGNRIQLLRGFDVAQLQFFLLKGGFDAGGDLTVDGTFGASTEKAVEEWQEEVGLPVTGAVDNTQIVFAPDPVRIASSARVGAAFSGLRVNDAEPSVQVDTTNRDRRALAEGTAVEVRLPDGTTTQGTVSTQEQTTDSAGTTVWRTTIRVADALPGDASSATVTVTEILAQDVLLVPVSALLALAEGGFAVEVVTDRGAGTSLVGVEVGEVLDGRAEVSGDLSVGDQVVVER